MFEVHGPRPLSFPQATPPLSHRVMALLRQCPSELGLRHRDAVLRLLKTA